MTEPVDVLLLTQANCAFCSDARTVLSRLRAEFELTVRTMDLGSPDGRALAESLGILFAPGIVIEGQLFSYGRPSERKLRKALARRWTRAGADDLSEQTPAQDSR